MIKVFKVLKLKVKVGQETKEYKSIWWDKEGVVNAIDQRKLPFSFEIFKARNLDDICFTIKNMVVRGAPLIGVTAAYGLVLTSQTLEKKKDEEFINGLVIAGNKLSKTRPTAADLDNAISEIMSIVYTNNTPKENIDNIKCESDILTQTVIDECLAIGKIGNQLITQDISNIMTICNAGALATVDIGTALAPIRKAKESGKELNIYVNETRPRMQGARLTAWELYNEDISHQIITDNSAGYFFKKGMIDMVLVGADRIVRNGDTANKIGTYILSLLCKEHSIPFYVAAPLSTFDLKTKTGNDIIIEERDGLEVRSAMSVNDEQDKIAKRRIIHHPHSPNLNPAFDITPAENITGIITPKGLLKNPFEKEIFQMLKT